MICKNLIYYLLLLVSSLSAAILASSKECVFVLEKKWRKKEWNLRLHESVICWVSVPQILSPISSSPPFLVLCYSILVIVALSFHCKKYIMIYGVNAAKSCPLSHCSSCGVGMETGCAVWSCLLGISWSFGGAVTVVLNVFPQQLCFGHTKCQFLAHVIGCRETLVSCRPIENSL